MQKVFLVHFNVMRIIKINNNIKYSFPSRGIDLMRNITRNDVKRGKVRL